MTMIDPANVFADCARSDYSPGKERLHALGASDLSLWDIKGKALKAPFYELFGGRARKHICPGPGAHGVCAVAYNPPANVEY